jgi:hypothetical protein
MVKMKMVMVRDDAVGNLWFIGQPIDVYYQYKAIGIYQIGKIFLLLLVQHFYLEILNYMMLILLMVSKSKSRQSFDFKKCLIGLGQFH